MCHLITTLKRTESHTSLFRFREQHDRTSFIINVPFFSVEAGNCPDDGSSIAPELDYQTRRVISWPIRLISFPERPWLSKLLKGFQRWCQERRKTLIKWLFICSGTWDELLWREQVKSWLLDYTKPYFGSQGTRWRATEIPERFKFSTAH